MSSFIVWLSPQHCVSRAAVLLFYLSLEYEFRLVGCGLSNWQQLDELWTCQRTAWPQHGHSVSRIKIWIKNSKRRTFFRTISLTKCTYLLRRLLFPSLLLNRIVPDGFALPVFNGTNADAYTWLAPFQRAQRPTEKALNSELWNSSQTIPSTEAHTRRYAFPIRYLRLNRLHYEHATGGNSAYLDIYLPLGHCIFAAAWCDEQHLLWTYFELRLLVTDVL